MHNHDVLEEQYIGEKNCQYKENRYTENQKRTEQAFECTLTQDQGFTMAEFKFVQRELEVIFPRRRWAATEIKCLASQMPIPRWEVLLVTRYYQLPSKQYRPNLLRGSRPEHEFF